MSSNDKTVTTKGTKNDEKTAEKTPSAEASTEATTASLSTEVKSSEAKSTEVKSTEVKLTDAKSAKGKPTEVKPTEVQTEEKEISSKTANGEKKGVLLGHRILRDFSKDYNKKTPTYFVGIITEYQPSENSPDIQTIFPSKKNIKDKKKRQSDLDNGLYRIRYLDKDKDEVSPSDAYVGCKLYNTLNKQKVYSTDLKTIFDKVKYPNPKNTFLMTDLVEEEKYYYGCYQDYLQDQKIEPATLVVPADEVCSKEEVVLTEYGYVPASAFDEKIMKRIVEQEATTTPKKRGRPKGSGIKTPEGSKSRGAKIAVKYTPVVTPKRKRGVSSVEKDRVKTTPAAKKQSAKKNKTPSATVEPMDIDKKDDAMDVDEKNDASKMNGEKAIEDKALPPPQDKKVEDKSEEMQTDQINSSNSNVNKTLGTSASAAKIIDSKVNKMQEVDLTQDDDDTSDNDKKPTAAEVDLTQDDDDSADNDKKPTAAEVDLTQDDGNDDEKNESKKTNDKVAEAANETKDAKQSTVTAATASPKKSAIDTSSAATKTDGTPDKPKEEDKNATAAATNNEIKKDAAGNSAAKDAK